MDTYFPSQNQGTRLVSIREFKQQRDEHFHLRTALGNLGQSQRTESGKARTDGLIKGNKLSILQIPAYLFVIDLHNFQTNMLCSFQAN